MSALNLHELSNRMLNHFLPVASMQHNLLVNEVPAELCIQSDRKLAASVLHAMVSGIVTQVENSCIRLSAKIFDGMILLSVTDGNGYNDCAVIEGMHEAPVAIAPVISIEARRKPGGFFSFPSSAA
jgi:hypothetical protein